VLLDVFNGTGGEVMDEELSEESLEKMIKEVRDMIAAMEEPTGKPNKVLIQPALLAQRGYTVEDVSKMIEGVSKMIRENTNERAI
jgi:SOS response regulatory protein OraA/RecX